jgi:hypothetical protein
MAERLKALDPEGPEATGAASEPVPAPAPAPPPTSDAPAMTASAAAASDAEVASMRSELDTRAQRIDELEARVRALEASATAAAASATAAEPRPPAPVPKPVKRPNTFLPVAAIGAPSADTLSKEKGRASHRKASPRASSGSASHRGKKKCTPPLTRASHP